MRKIVIPYRYFGSSRRCPYTPIDDGERVCSREEEFIWDGLLQYFTYKNSEKRLPIVMSCEPIIENWPTSSSEDFAVVIVVYFIEDADLMLFTSLDEFKQSQESIERSIEEKNGHIKSFVTKYSAHLEKVIDAEIYVKPDDRFAASRKQQEKSSYGYPTFANRQLLMFAAPQQEISPVPTSVVNVESQQATTKSSFCLLL